MREGNPVHSTDSVGLLSLFFMGLCLGNNVYWVFSLSDITDKRRMFLTSSDFLIDNYICAFFSGLKFTFKITPLKDYCFEEYFLDKLLATSVNLICAAASLGFCCCCCCSVLFCFIFFPSGHKLKSHRKQDSQLSICLYKTDLWACLWGILLIVD